MNASQSDALSEMYLSWVNHQLRREAELVEAHRAEALSKQSVMKARVQSFVIAGVSVLSLFVIKLFDL